MNNQPLVKIGNLLGAIRRTKPLVHHLTNYVTVNDCANVTLAIGASPVMADDIGEAAEIAAISSALVLNIGTLNQRTVESMLKAGEKANETGIPIVLDPVGVGASALRNNTAETLLKRLKFAAIRGNISEIRSIAGLHTTIKGVDASEEDLGTGIQSGADVAGALAEKYGCVVVVTGAADIISDGKNAICIENGHPMLGSITGTGCMCTSLVGSFCAVTDDYLTAAAAGILCMGIAGEVAFEEAGQKGTGSYRVSLIDEISKMNSETIQRRAKLHEA